uniref:COMM domain-containing protein n=1 Tax=Araucaria cunninghamii TaxID=56994 RepID=A0A0D6R9L8_ARACU
MEENNEDGFLPKSSSFRSAILLVDGVHSDRLSLLLERILHKLTKEEEPFTEIELFKLQEVLGLSTEELQSLIDACTFTFEQAAMNSASVTKLIDNLKLFGLSSFSVAVFQDLWMRSGPSLIIAFREKPFGAPGTSQLVDVQWRVHMQVASSEERQHEPMGILQMNLSTPEKGYKTSGEKSFALEFFYTELFDFYEKLEQIQEQLDSLS